MPAATAVRHGKEVREVFGCMHTCIAELARVVTIALDVTPYLQGFCDNPPLQLLWKLDICLKPVRATVCKVNRLTGQKANMLRRLYT